MTETTLNAPKKKVAARKQPVTITPHPDFPATLHEVENGSLVIYCYAKTRLQVNNTQIYYAASHTVTIPEGYLGLLRTCTDLVVNRVHLVNPLILTPGTHSLELDLDNRNNAAYRYKFKEPNWFKAALLTVINAPIEKL